MSKCRLLVVPRPRQAESESLGSSPGICMLVRLQVFFFMCTKCLTKRRLRLTLPLCYGLKSLPWFILSLSSPGPGLGRPFWWHVSYLCFPPVSCYPKPEGCLFSLLSCLCFHTTLGHPLEGPTLCWNFCQLLSEGPSAPLELKCISYCFLFTQNRM